MDRRILVPGIAPVQADFVSLCREYGFSVFTCANSERGPARALSHGFELIDITHREGVLAYARSVGADLVYTVGSDMAMPTVCWVSEQMGLPRFVSSRTAEVCNSKHLLRERLGREYRWNLRFQVLESPEEALEIPFPLVLKPVDSQGQRGVRFAASPGEVPALFAESVSFSRSGKVIAEELVEGPEVAVTAYLAEGRLLSCLPVDRVSWPQFPGGILRKVVFPSQLCASPALAAEIRLLAEETAARLEIRNGPMGLQVKMGPMGPRLIEATPRFGGAHFWRLQKLKTGKDKMRVALDHLLGRLPSEDSFPEHRNGDTWELEFFCDHPDVPFDPDKFDASGAEYLQWYYSRGEKIARATGLYEKTGYMIRRGEGTGAPGICR